VLAEELAAEGARFDAVLSLEVAEHVADVPAFTAALASLAEPRGVLVLSTVNRTLRSYALGVVAAERLLSLVPAGTHDWSRFLTPDELAGACEPRRRRMPASSCASLPRLTRALAQPRSRAAASRWMSSRAWCTRRWRAAGSCPQTRPSTTWRAL
jgi:2-polyprenyl-6-hydroxyphenyl methylase/3-demethylubiquinone-9 3-methyltransferase